MKDEGFTERELAEIAQHEIEFLENKISILQAIEDLRLNKMSRETLEEIAAESLLRLSSLEYELNFSRKYQRMDISRILEIFESLKTGKFKGVYEKIRNFDKSKGSKARNEKDPTRQAIAEVKVIWESHKKAHDYKLPAREKQKFIRSPEVAEIEKKYEVTLKVGLLNNSLKYQQ